jgi:hypothetical protein
MSKESDANIEIIESYDNSINLFDMEYIRKIVKIQRTFRKFCIKNKETTILKNLQTHISKSSLCNKSHFSDVQSIISRASNKISKKRLNRSSRFIY